MVKALVNKMKKFIFGLVIGILSTWLFTKMIVTNQEDASEIIYIDTMDISAADSVVLENEYFKRFSPKHILNVLLHNYSMKGTIYEDSWDSMSDNEKIQVLLEE